MNSCILTMLEVMGQDVINALVAYGEIKTEKRFLLSFLLVLY